MAQNETKVADRLKAMNNDTVRYLKDYILARKDSYTDKPLDSLLKDMPLPVNSYINTVSDKMFIYPATYISIYSYNEKTTKISQQKNPLSLIITWKAPLTKNELINQGLQSLGGEWTQAAYNFFLTKIISSISMVKYDF